MSATDTRPFPHGDPLAEEGSLGWANRTRMQLLAVAKNLRADLDQLRVALVPFIRGGHWNTVEREDRTTFGTFREFVTAPRPWGLQQKDYGRFLLLLEAAAGDQFPALAAELGLAPASPLDRLKDDFRLASEEERELFFRWVNNGGDAR